MAKSRCGTCGQWFEDDELDDLLNQHDEPELSVPERKRLTCPDCQIVMDSYLGVPFNIGQSDTATRLVSRMGV